MTSGNHEFDGGQFEINLTHSDALSAADRAFRFKSAIKELARKEGKLATFMAKPFNDAGGSGFHLHLSCDSSTTKAPVTPSTIPPGRTGCPPPHATPSPASSPTPRPWPHWPTRP